VNVLVKIGIGALVIGGVFAFLWWRGYLERISNYVLATREELRKCTWPTVEELKGSTTVVVIAILLLSAFTVITDLVVVAILDQIMRMAA
jgi:preprotein translocase subunit SecE